MGRKRKSPEKAGKSKKGLGRRARKQQPPEIPDSLVAKGSWEIPVKSTCVCNTIMQLLRTQRLCTKRTEQIPVPTAYLPCCLLRIRINTEIHNLTNPDPNHNLSPIPN